MTIFEDHQGIYIIAEIWINHDGDVDCAKRLIQAGVDGSESDGALARVCFGMRTGASGASPSEMDRRSVSS